MLPDELVYMVEEATRGVVVASAPPTVSFFCRRYKTTCPIAFAHDNIPLGTYDMAEEDVHGVEH